MNIKEFSSIQDRISTLSEYIKTPESSKFDTDDIFPCLSNSNRDFLAPISNYLNIYLNCLKNVTRWKNHIYSEATESLEDNDYNHVLEMLKINQQFREIGLSSVNFDTVELMILVHDGGEIITDDISSNNKSQDSSIKKIKELEPRVFGPLIIRQIKGSAMLSYRRTLNQLYRRYESRQNNPSDVESHLVKLIDMCQGNSYGLENVYSKEKLNKVYPSGVFPTNPDEIILEMINKELSQSKLISETFSNPTERETFNSFYLAQHFSKFSHPDYGYSHLVESIR